MRVNLKKIVSGRELPSPDPKLFFMGCIDMGLIHEGTYIAEELLGYKPGQYFENKIAGSLNDFISDDVNISSNSFRVLQLAVDKGIEAVALTAHTKCAADEKLRFKSAKQEFQHQKKKVEAAFNKLDYYRRVRGWELLIFAYLYECYEDSSGHKANVIQVEFKTKGRKKRASADEAKSVPPQVIAEKHQTAAV